MFDRFTDRAKKVMHLARQEAQRFNHEYLGTEHILLGLVQEGSGVAANVLKNMAIDLNKIRAEVEKIVKTGPSMVTMGQLPFTPRAKSVLELSMEEASNLGHDHIGTEHLLLGLIRENEGTAAQVLNNLGAKLEEVREEVLQFLGAEEARSEARVGSVGATVRTGPDDRDLTELAREGKLDTPVGRTAEIEKVVRILSRRTCRNVFLVGPPGVGRGTIVEGVAPRIVGAEVPAVLTSTRLVEVDLAGLATADRAHLAERIQSFLEQPKHRGAVFFFRHLDALIGTPRPPAALRGWQALRAGILNHQVQCITSCTPEVATALFAEDPALERLFQVVHVGEPSPAESLEILKGLRDRLEAHHRVQILDEALEASVELSSLYLVDQHLPSKAVDLLDEASALMLTRAFDPPAGVQELQAQIEALDRAKEDAIWKQDFELAAKNRDSAIRLRQEKERLYRDWRQSRELAEDPVDRRFVCMVLADRTGIPLEDIERKAGLPTPTGAGSVPSTGVPEYERAQVESVLHGNEIRVARGFGFVLLPHREEFERVFEQAIRPALHDNGLEALKGNDISEPGAILSQVWKEIRKAEVIVADVSDRNPNVIYELGLCHGIRRCPLLLVRDPDELPFNIQSLRYLAYDPSPAGLADLHRRLTLSVRQFLSAVRTPRTGP